ncbi:hypothetical protein [Streptomyces mirabilis]|uniref:hypothetical protein n=1 Tax=Streptomyces mirabilis TaxID=68239 RepID=UPI0036833000
MTGGMVARYFLEANAVYQTCTLTRVADLPADTPVRIFTQRMDESTGRWGQTGWVEVLPASETDAEYAFVTNLTLGTLR